VTYIRIKDYASGATGTNLIGDVKCIGAIGNREWMRSTCTTSSVVIHGGAGPTGIAEGSVGKATGIGALS
jgi:hypothetical protein